MIISQIVNIYENQLPKCKIMLSHQEAIEYFERMLMQGNIITYVRDNELLGFMEFWRVNYEQFGRLCCNITLSHDEDLLNGNIALITRAWINEDLRNTDIFVILSSMFLSRNKDCTHFAAFQNHKIHKPLQVYTREEIMKHYK